MEQDVFDRFRAIIYETSGISLNDNKVALVSARVAKRMRALGLADYEAYLDHVSSDQSGEELVQLMDVISTNVTQFFREEQHFHFLAERIAEWLRGGARRLRIWSAGCSSGEEPYTIAMSVAESCNGHDVDTKILATDISTRILAKARAGVYDDRKIEGVPPVLRDRYFRKSGLGDEAQYSVVGALKEKIKFSRLNLKVVPFPMKGPFDAIFCRNVMIYFDNNMRRSLLGEYHRLLKTGGYLFVGHAESLTGMLSGMKGVMPSVYVKT